MKRRDLLKAVVAAPVLPLLLRSSRVDATGLFHPHVMRNADGKAPVVHLVAPSSYPKPVYLADMKRGISRLREMGFVVRGERVLHRVDTRFAGTDAQRADDINALAKMEKLPDIVLATRGGYGASRLLEHLHYGALRERLHGKPVALVGHSDFTVLQMALYRKSGLSSFAGPLLVNLGEDPADRSTWNHFYRTLGSASHSVHWRTSNRVHLSLTGPLWGGNLTMLCSVLGTPYFPHIEDGILFVEDVGTAAYRVERMLYQLHLSGVLGRQKALLMGDCVGCSAGGVSDNGYNLESALRQIAKVAGVPLIRGFPHGHGRHQLTLPFAAPARLTVQDHRATLSFKGYPRPYSIT